MKKIRRYAGIFQDIKIPWGMLIIVFALSIAESYLVLEQSTLTADVIDASQKAINGSKLIQFVVTLTVYAVVYVASSYTGEWTFQKINRGVRVKLWNKIMRLPSRCFDDESRDELVSRVTTDASESYLYFYVVIYVVSAIYAAFVTIRLMYHYSPELTRMFLLLVPVCLIIAALFGRLSFAAEKKAQVTFAESVSYLVERTRNLRLIKAVRMEYPEQEMGRKKFNRQFRVSFLSTFSNASTMVIYAIINCATLIISFVFGGQMVNAGEVTVGRLVGFYTLSGVLSLRLMQVIMFYTQMKGADGRLEKIAQVLELPEEEESGIELDLADADLVAENITFSYGDRPALQNIHFRIPKGEVTAIIGANGAGKSTVFKLIERMYDPDEGALLFGKDNVKTFRLRSWRQSFAIVSQDKPLLNGTVRDNILYGVQRKVTEEELIYVAKQANIYDFIMETPGGFDAQVGSGGSNFSGGQRQCIAIARAMMRNPDYLLLDEATSNLDAKSEQLVSQALANLMRGRTTVMIAHNYSATRNAGHIIVMSDGRVEAEGTPEELLKTNAYYRTFAGMAAE